jgi:hypothetical protein
MGYAPLPKGIKQGALVKADGFQIFFTYQVRFKKSSSHLQLTSAPWALVSGKQMCRDFSRTKYASKNLKAICFSQRSLGVGASYCK